MELFLNDQLGKITIEIDEAASATCVFILAHGAGAGVHHPSMVSLSDKFVEYGFHCARFNFPYMEQGRKSPGSPKPNIETWGLVIEHISKRYPDLPLYISGKSYGGRMGSHFIAENPTTCAKGIVYFGFPLHAPGRDSKDRAAHLSKIQLPQLFIQGVNDKLANIEMMREVVADISNATLIEIEHADHSFNVPKKSGLTKAEVLTRLVDEIDAWK
jgi:uncharacterized protein